MKLSHILMVSSTLPVGIIQFYKCVDIGAVYF